MIGNPPYSNFGQQNKNSFILSLLDDYKKGLSEKKLNLDDDFIKFIRLFQHMVDEAGAGIVGVITNNAYIDGITHREMRKSLLKSFRGISILDLHGSAKKREQGPDTAREENVFDIQQGVSISLLLQVPEGTRCSTVQHYEVWGSRESKYQTLSVMSPQSIEWSELTPSPDAYFFVPKDLKESDEYRSFWSLDDIMRESISGVQSKKDSLFVDFDRSVVRQRLSDFLDPTRRSSSAHLMEMLGPKDDWLVRKASEVKYTEEAIRQSALSTKHPDDLLRTQTIRKSTLQRYEAYAAPQYWSRLYAAECESRTI